MPQDRKVSIRSDSVLNLGDAAMRMVIAFLEGPGVQAGAPLLPLPKRRTLHGLTLIVDRIAWHHLDRQDSASCGELMIEGEPVFTLGTIGDGKANGIARYGDHRMGRKEQSERRAADGAEEEHELKSNVCRFPVGRTGNRRVRRGVSRKDSCDVKATFKDVERLHKHQWEDLQAKLLDVNAICKPKRVDDVGEYAVRVVGLEVEYDPGAETIKHGQRPSDWSKPWKYILNTVKSYGFELNEPLQK
jgi:hypothetical protein